MAIGKFISRYASFSLIIGPILQPYNLLGKSIALLLMFINVTIFSVYTICGNTKKLIKPEPTYILCLFYFLTLPILLGSIMYKVDIGASVRGLLVFSASLLLYASYVDLLSIKKIYRFFVVLAIFVFVVQELFFFIYGIRFPALIPFLELNYEMGMENYAEYLMYRERSSSFFLEPAHLAIFVLPYFILKMVDNKNTKKILSAEVVVLTVFFIYLRSGLGFLCLLTIWSLFLFQSNISRQRKTAFLLCTCLLLIIVLLFSGFGTYLYDSFFSRATELTGDNSNGSGMIRITRGYLVYQDFPLIGKIFGVSNGATTEVVMRSSAYHLFNDETFLNNTQKLLIGYGFVGIFLFLCYITKISKTRNQYSLYLMIAFVEICFMENMLFDGRMLIYFGIAAIPSYKFIIRNSKCYDKKSIYNY